MVRLKGMLARTAWKLTAHYGRRPSFRGGTATTALVVYHNPLRARHMRHQVKVVLQCSCVSRVVIASHNPALRIDDPVLNKEPRVTITHESVDRGCGHRWFTAEGLEGDYFLVIDDDILLFPSQIATLVESLLMEPDRPHGLSGLLCLEGGGFAFHQSEERDVDCLCEVYAVTRQHLQRYIQMTKSLAQNASVAAAIQRFADFVVISAAGTRKPRIHNVGHVLRCSTFNRPGVAAHAAPGFFETVSEVYRAVCEV